MSHFGETMARFFPVIPEDVASAMTKLRDIRAETPAMLTVREAGAILNALVRYEAIAQGAAEIAPTVTQEVTP